MKSIRISTLFLITIMFSIIVPSFIGTASGELNQGDSNGDANIQALPGQPEKRFLNASITDSVRNITITRTGRVILEDALTLEIHDNETFIDSFNYSLPSVFTKNVEKVSFFVKRGNNVGIQDSKFGQSYDVFFGQEVTTYTFSIRENGTNAPANSTEGIFIYSEIIAIGAINFHLLEDIQIGILTIPLRGLYSNLAVTGSIIGVRLDAAADKFNKTAMNEIPWPGNSESTLPILRDFLLLEWRDLTSPVFDVETKLVEDYDFVDVHIISETPDAGDETNQDTGTTPYSLSNAERVVKIDPWGFVYITETLTIKHVGAGRPEAGSTLDLGYRILGFSLLLDKAANIDDLQDSLGTLNIGELEDGKPQSTLLEGKRVLAVTFRNPIFGGEEYTFKVKYHFNSTDVISVESNAFEGKDLYRLNTTLFSSYNITIQNFKTTYEFPATAQLVFNGFRTQSSESSFEISTRITRSTLSFFEHLELEIKGQDVSFTDNNQFVIEYTFSGAGYFNYIFTFVLFVILILTIYLGLPKLLVRLNITRSEEIKAEREKIPIGEIDAFLKYFTEQNDAHNSIAYLTDKRRKNKLTQKDYTGKVKAVRRRLRENSPKLETASTALTKQGRKYEKLVSKIMISGQKVNDIRSNEASTRNSFAKKQIAKDIFHKLMREYRINLDDHESTINKSLSELNDAINLQ